MTRAKEMRDLPLAIDATASGNVGIGGTANEYSNYTTLTINHNTSGGILDIERNGNLVGELYTLSATDFGIQTGQATGAMRFRTNAGEVLTLLHTGNVGIGSNNPGADLDIHNSNGATLFMDDTNGRSLNFRTANNSTQNSNISSYAGLYLGGSDNANHVVIESGGDVGIGTNNPFYRLQIDQGTTATYATSFRNTADNLQLVVGTTTGGLINIQGKTINNGAAYKIALQSEGGNVGIGTANPLAQLEIDPSAVDTPIFAIRRQDSTSIPLFKFFQDSSVAQGTGHAHINTHNRDLSITADASSTKTLGIYLKTTGQVGIGTDSPLRNFSVIGSNTTSSGYKDIAEFLEPSITGGTVSVNFGVANSLNNLGKVDFTYVGAGSTGNWVSIGFHSNDNKLKVYANGLVEVASYLKSKKGTIQTVVNQPTIYTSANPINTWAEVHSNFRIDITPRFASGTKILGTYSVPINPTGAANILMAIQPWYSTDGGTTKTILNQGGPNGSRLTGSHAWFRSSNGYDGNDMQNHVVHFGYTHSATTTLTWGFYFRSEGSNTTYFCASNGNSSLWGWTAPLYMELREVEIA